VPANPHPLPGSDRRAGCDKCNGRSRVKAREASAGSPPASTDSRIFADRSFARVPRPGRTDDATVSPTRESTLETLESIPSSTGPLILAAAIRSCQWAGGSISLLLCVALLPRRSPYAPVSKTTSMKGRPGRRRSSSSVSCDATTRPVTPADVNRVASHYPDPEHPGQSACHGGEKAERVLQPRSDLI